jgi:hypothetical protein
VGKSTLRWNALDREGESGLDESGVGRFDADRHAVLLQGLRQNVFSGNTFIRLCETMAEDLLRPYDYVLVALSTVLRTQRTLSGEKIDNVIATTVAGFESAAEQARRRRWQRIVDNAAEFETVSY